MASNALTHINSLPPELLQTVWRQLPFVDLLHCQQVCVLWKAYLPGNDPALRAALFSETANRDEADATDSDEEDTLETLSICFDLKQELVVRSRQLPQIKFVLSANTVEYYDAYGHKNHGCFHPIMSNIGQYMDVVHPRFERRKVASMGKDMFTFSFLDFKGLKKLAEPVEYKGASCESMQIASPPIQSFGLFISWYTDYEDCGHDDHDSDITHWLGNESGVTVGQFVEAIRETLVKAEEVIKEFTECLTQVVIDRVDDTG